MPVAACLPDRVHSHEYRDRRERGSGRVLAVITSSYIEYCIKSRLPTYCKNDRSHSPVILQGTATASVQVLPSVTYRNMPYIMVMGNLSAPHLSKDEGATVYGLKSDERATLVRELNSSFNNMPVATTSDQERTVRITQKGLTLVVVNRIHGLLGYDVVSHAMAMTNANRELISFTMYKKSNPSSHGHGHDHSKSHKGHGHSNVVTL